MVIHLNIYIYWTCGVFEKGPLDEKEKIERLYKTLTLLTNNGHIVLCKSYDNYIYTTKQIISPNNMKVLTKKYKISTFTGIEKIIPGTVVTCKYRKNDNDEEKRLKEKLDYRNFIKPLSERPSTLGE